MSDCLGGNIGDNTSRGTIYAGEYRNFLFSGLFSLGRKSLRPSWKINIDGIIRLTVRSMDRTVLYYTVPGSNLYYTVVISSKLTA